jgi:hypothetical protein
MESKELLKKAIAAINRALAIKSLWLCGETKEQHHGEAMALVSMENSFQELSDAYEGIRDKYE